MASTNPPLPPLRHPPTARLAAIQDAEAADACGIASSSPSAAAAAIAAVAITVRRRRDDDNDNDDDADDTAPAILTLDDAVAAAMVLALRCVGMSL